MTDEQHDAANKEVVDSIEDAVSRVRQAAGRILILQARVSELQKALGESQTAHASSAMLLYNFMKHVAKHIEAVPIPDEPNEFLSLEDIDALWRIR